MSFICVSLPPERPLRKTPLVHFPTCLLSLFSVFALLCPPSTPVITATALR